MIVDTSTIMAILLDEPEKPDFIAKLAHATTPLISAGSWIELAAVQVRGNPHYHSALEQLVAQFGIAIEPVSVRQAELGHAAYREYGIGSGHGARLNFGDCFAYALAKATGEPLLFKGNDFAQTDITPA